MIKFIITVVAIFFVFNLSAGQNCLPPQSINNTGHYLDLFFKNNNRDLKQELKSKLKDYRFLIIPGIDFDFQDGFYNQLDLKLIKVFIEKFFSGREKFIDYQHLLAELNLPYYQMSINDFRNRNEFDKVGKIIELIRDSKKNLVIIAHSKGGTDLLDALIKMNHSIYLKNYINKIKGIIFLQTPIQGSPLANVLYELSHDSNFRWIEGVINWATGLNRKTAKNLSLEYRANFNEIHHDFFNQLGKKIPIISFSSSIPSDSTRYKMQIFKLFRDISFESSGLDNDGLIPCNSAFINSPFVTVTNLDHLTIINSSSKQQRRGTDYDRKKMILVLLKLLFDN